MKKYFYILSFSLLLAMQAAGGYAQNKKDNIVMPEYPGGQKALHEFIMSELTYPAEAMQNNEVGEVIVGFSIGIDGSVSGVRALKSVSKALDEEAIRVVKKTRYWNPGKKNGRPVRAEMSIPINFKVIYDAKKFIDDDEVGRTGRSDNEKNRVLY